MSSVCTVQLSGEDQLVSKIATENGLVAVGKQMLLEEQERERKEKLRKKIMEMVQTRDNSFSDDETPRIYNTRSGNSSYYEGKYKLLKKKYMKYCNNFQKYLDMNEEDKNILRKELAELKDSYDTLSSESDFYIEQIDEYEELDDKNKKRILLLRKKCIEKNSTINSQYTIIKYLLFLQIVCFGVIYNNLFGFPEIEFPEIDLVVLKEFIVNCNVLVYTTIMAIIGNLLFIL